MGGEVKGAWTKSPLGPCPAKRTLRAVRRLAALLDVLPLQIPALRHSSTDEGGSQHSAAQRSGTARTPLSRRGPIPYVKLCGLRLPDTLTPAVDEPHEAQVVICIGQQSMLCSDAIPGWRDMLGDKKW